MFFGVNIDGFLFTFELNVADHLYTLFLSLSPRQSVYTHTDSSDDSVQVFNDQCAHHTFLVRFFVWRKTITHKIHTQPHISRINVLSRFHITSLHVPIDFIFICKYLHVFHFCFSFESCQVSSEWVGWH